jgi:4-hydroxy-3-polyprenylbenzoate decarboxylase
VDLIISPSGFLILEDELSLKLKNLKGKGVARAVSGYLENKGRRGTAGGAAGAAGRGELRYTPYDDIASPSPLASGSCLPHAMIICPCSMGTLARVAAGISGNLIERATDCVIKEKARLVIVPRETPLSAIHLENMLKLARMGVTVLPAMPGFYHHPRSLDEMVDFVVGKVLDTLGIENELFKRWEGK